MIKSVDVLALSQSEGDWVVRNVTLKKLRDNGYIKKGSKPDEAQVLEAAATFLKEDKDIILADSEVPEKVYYSNKKKGP